MNDRTPERNHRRTNVPNRLDANAIRLLEALPPTVRLTHLRGQYPRVLNRIAGTWNDVAAFNALVDSLLIMDRNNREGFPFEVLREISDLREYYGVTHPPGWVAPTALED